MSETQTPIHQLKIVTDAHMSQPLWVAVSNALMGTTPERALFDVIVNPTTVLLGTDLVPADGWTATGWTGSLVDGFTHTAGNTSPLENTIAAIVDKIYQLSLIISGRTAGSVSIDFGGVNVPEIISTDTEVIIASTNGNLVITPTTDFDGTILISLKQQTWQPMTGAEILAALGVSDVVQSSQLAAYALAVLGKSLVLDTIIAKLPQCYTINLPAGGSLSAKVAAAIAADILSPGTYIPTGFTIAVTDGSNLTVTHGLGKEVKDVTVKKVVGTVKKILKPYSTAYSDIVATSTSILVIEGIDPSTDQTLIHLTFMP